MEIRCLLLHDLPVPDLYPTSDGQPKHPNGDGAGRRGGKVLLLASVAVAAVAGYFALGNVLDLESLAQREAALRDFQQQRPILTYLSAFTSYVVVTGLSLPFASGMSLVLGWYFRFWPALVLVSFASTAGATVAFLLSRYLLRDVVQSRFGDRLRVFNESLDREGAFYLFTLRLFPGVPFFAINAVMGLTRISTPTFWWVSQLGMLPGTIVYIYAGSRVPELRLLSEQGARAVFTPSQLAQLSGAFLLLGLFPTILKVLFSRWRGSRALH